jgi:hypothetical protein
MISPGHVQNLPADAYSPMKKRGKNRRNQNRLPHDGLTPQRVGPRHARLRLRVAPVPRSRASTPRRKSKPLSACLTR